MGFERFYEKNYKKLLLIPVVLLLFCIIYQGIFFSRTGEFFQKDISLTGGTTVTIYEDVSKEEIMQEFSGIFDSLNIREIYDLISQEQKAIIIETTTESSIVKQELEQFLGYELNEDNSSIEFTGASIGKSFYQQLLIAIIVAFILMGIVVFFLFKTAIPSSAVILSAFADLFMTLVFVNLFGVKLSSAGIVAFLMLIGYSVDTDILLTTRILKRTRGTINERMGDAFKTGVTMTLTSLLAISFAYFIIKDFSSTLAQIFFILIIGLCFDLLNTWITNASILKWYVESQK
jgi:preprotein translocase subunit SecF